MHSPSTSTARFLEGWPELTLPSPPTQAIVPSQPEEVLVLEDVRGGIGSQQFPIIISSPTSPLASFGVKASLNPESPDISTGSLSLAPKKR